MRLSQLHPNEGQINGVPNNPRKITEVELNKLKNSIKNAPEFLSARPIIVNEAFEILGGNMRYRALCLLRDEKVFDDVIPEEWVRIVKWTRKKQREFVLRDNQSNGKDDLELLAKWDTKELAEWGANVPIFDDEEQKPYDGEGQKLDDTEPQQYATFETVKKKRKKLWSKDVKSTAATDMKECISFHSLDGGGFLSVYKKADQGYLLSDIKDVSHSEFVEVFAQAAYKAVKMYISIGNVSDFAIITTPRRRHSEGFHFASAVCERLQDLTRIRYYDDIVAAKNKSRLEPDFELVSLPKEHTIILYDDILTTGTTIRATRQLLLNANKNVITIIGVLNR